MSVSWVGSYIGYLSNEKYLRAQPRQQQNVYWNELIVSKKKKLQSFGL